MTVKYDAFISYSHRQDSSFAPDLEKGLEQLAKPTFKRKALNVFRDSNDLSAAPNLWAKIEAGLNASDYFIFLASPRASQSKWCKKEVDFWKENKSKDHLLIALTEGDIFWDETKSDFDWSRTTAIPENLSGYFEDEPLFIDFREEIEKQNLILSNADFKQRVATLAATIHGRTVGDMIGEDVRQHKKTIRIRNGAIIVLSALLLGAAGLTYYAFEQRDIAQEEKDLKNKQIIETKKETDRAEQETLRQRAASYQARAESLLYTDKTEALKVAYEGLQFVDSSGLNNEEILSTFAKLIHDPNPMYIGSSHPALLQTFEFPVETRNYNGSSLSIRPNGSWNEIVLSKPGSDEIPIYDGNFGSNITYLSFTPQGQIIIGVDGEIAKQDSVEYQTDYHLAAISLEGRYLGISSAFLGPDIIGGEQNAKILYDPKEQLVFYISGMNPDRRASVSFSNWDRQFHLSHNNQHVTDIAIDRRSGALAYCTSEGEIRVVHLNYGEILSEWTVNAHSGQSIDSIFFSGDGQQLVSYADGGALVWPVHANRRSKIFPERKNFFSEGPESLPGDGVITQFGEVWGEDPPLSFEYISAKGVKSTFEVVKNFTSTPVQNRELQGREFELTSPDSSYVFKKNGIYNNKNELVLPIDADFEGDTHRHYSHVSFSNDSRYLLIVDTKMSLPNSERVKLFCLDIDEIIERVKSKPELFGNILP